jgi:adenine-specific DNA-methyltransferase
MVNLVEQMLNAKQQLAAARSERDQTFYEHKCQHLNREIDRLVYELYDLTEEEIALVEG